MIRTILTLGLLTVSARADLVATFTREGKTDSRLDRFPALSVPAGEPVTPFLTAGAFDAAWKGKLVVPSRQRVAFSFDGEGAVRLKIAGEEVLAREGALAGEATKVIRLNAGEHDIEVTYKSKPDGSGSLRLYWEETGFPRQTVPPSAFKTEPDAAATLGEQQRLGRLAFARQNCMKCHVSKDGPGTMPETVEFAPLVFGIGERVSEEWLRRWIADPHGLRPTTTMPALMDGKSPEGRQHAADLTAFLLASKTGTAIPAAPAAPDPAMVRDGGVIFHELGCVGCHNPPDAATPDPARVPLNNVAFKYLAGSLAAYLKKPDTHHPFSRMPDFKLSDQEAGNLAAYLTAASKGRETQATGEFPAGDAARGAKLAESMNCGACHPGLPMAPPASSPSLEQILTKDWTASGCAAPADKRGKSPVLNLDDTTRAALAAFSKTGGDSLRRDTAAEFTRRQIDDLRCTACHTQDDRISRLENVHAESAPLTAHLPKLNERVDQTRPQLTFVGEMLYTSYIESVLSGTAAPRPRPWLGSRMPVFQSRASQLAAGFSRIHGLEPNKPPAFKPDPALVEIGAKLAGTEGFGCTTCHAVGEQRATAAFEVEGLDFHLVPERLRKEYFQRWMDNPKSVTPATKMPRYSTGNQSPRADVLEGDAAKQYDAIWHYLHAK